MKKFLMVFAVMLIVGVTSFNMFANISNDQDAEIIPEKELPKHYEKDNEYVSLNNKLVKAMNDVEEGKITEEEYLKICNEISAKMDTEKEMQELKQEEEKFKEEIGEK